MDEDMQALKDEIDSTAMLVREHREQCSMIAGDLVIASLCQRALPPFDPNGAIWKGRCHLYIFRINVRVKSRSLGHISSTDLFHWRHHPTGLLDGMWQR